MIEKRFEIKDTLKCSGLALALFAIAMYIPVLSLFVCLVPAFVAVSTYRNSLKMGTLGALVVVLGAFLLFGVSGILVSLELVILGLFIGELMRRKMEPSYVIVLGAIFFVMMFIGGVLISGEGSTHQVLDNMLVSYEETLMASGESIIASVDGENYIVLVVNQIREIFPSFLFGTGIVIAIVNYYFAGYMLMKMYLKRQVPMFSEFTLPGQVLVGALGIICALFLMNYIGFAYYESLTTNAIIVFSLLFYLQGLACIYNKLMSKAGPVVRGALMIVLVLFLPAYSIIQMIGFFDAGFNIRKLTR